MQVVQALAQHQHAAFALDEDPARWFLHDLEAEDVRVELRRGAHVVHREYVAVAQDHGSACALRYPKAPQLSVSIPVMPRMLYPAST
jgi:hypothetical protein